MKLYAYVDETGQDTNGQFFIVSVVIVRGDGDPLRQALREVERDSRKLDKKWTKSRPAQREAYMRGILSLKPLHGSLYYALHRNTSDYVDLTIQSAAQALLGSMASSDQATILVDGLARSERQRFARRLRQHRIVIDKVRGLKDESDALIRLADALAGFVRHSIEERHAGLQAMYAAALAEGTLRQL